MSDETLSVLMIEGSRADTLAFHQALLKERPGAVVDVSATSADAFERLKRSALSSAKTPSYNITVVNLACCDRSPLAIIAEFTEIMPDVPVIAVVPPETDDVSTDVVRAGASEVVLATPGFGHHLACIVRLTLEAMRLRREIDQQRFQLLELASRDELTNLANRRRFNEAIDLEVERAHRFHRPITLILFDLDGLKGINDTHGHPAGDAALRHIASCLRTETRRFEVAARLGGDEFAVLLVDTNFDQGRLVAEKLRRHIAEVSVPPAGQVTISAGVASLPAHAETADELIRIADQALYEAKNAGRNKVVLSPHIRQERDGDRHPVRFKVVVAGRTNHGEPFTEETETELISRRGARILSAHTVAAGDQIQLRTPFHPRPLLAQVTSCYRGADNRCHVGFKLLDPTRWSG